MFIDYVQCKFNWLNNCLYICIYKFDVWLINKNRYLYKEIKMLYDF